MAQGNDAAPEILDLPIGLDATGMRAEFDSLGRVEVPADHYWGAQSAGRPVPRWLAAARRPRAR